MEYALFLDRSFDDHVTALCCDGVVMKSIMSSRKDVVSPCQIWQRLLDEQNLSLSDISFYICGVGPGSYTGIRAAAATVLASAFATNKPIVPISSLALCVPPDEASCFIIVDARSGGVYVQEVENCIFLKPCRIGFSEALKLVKPGQTIVVRSLEWVMKIAPQTSETGRVKEVSLDPTVAVKLAYQERESLQISHAFSLPLLYLRKTQPEEYTQTS